VPRRWAFGLSAAAPWREQGVNSLCDNLFKWHYTYVRSQFIRLVAGINNGKSIELEIGQPILR
jgi:hypothetical protein